MYSLRGFMNIYFKNDSSAIYRNNNIILKIQLFSFLLSLKIFEVKIDKKVNSWSGSIEVGVTACDPDLTSL